MDAKKIQALIRQRELEQAFATDRTTRADILAERVPVSMRDDMGFKFRSAKTDPAEAMFDEIWAVAHEDGCAVCTTGELAARIVNGARGGVEAFFREFIPPWEVTQLAQKDMRGPAAEFTTRFTPAWVSFKDSRSACGRTFFRKKGVTPLSDEGFPWVSADGTAAGTDARTPLSQAMDVFIFAGQSAFADIVGIADEIDTWNSPAGQGLFPVMRVGAINPALLARLPMETPNASRIVAAASAARGDPLTTLENAIGGEKIDGTVTTGGQFMIVEQDTPEGTLVMWGPTEQLAGVSSTAAVPLNSATAMTIFGAPAHLLAPFGPMQPVWEDSVSRLAHARDDSPGGEPVVMTMQVSGSPADTLGVIGRQTIVGIANGAPIGEAKTSAVSAPAYALGDNSARQEQRQDMLIDESFINDAEGDIDAAAFLADDLLEDFS